MLLNVVNSCSTKVWLSGWRYRNFGEANSWNRFTSFTDATIDSRLMYDDTLLMMLAVRAPYNKTLNVRSCPHSG